MRAVTFLGGLALATAAAAAQPTRKPSDADRGRDLYQRHCLACHGAGARGDGPAAAALVHPPADLQGKVAPDPARIAIVLKGKAAMPAFEQSFGTEDARRVLTHMQGLTDAPQPAPADPRPEPPPVDDAPVEGGGG
jgi:mono/diheme cytochrome c family protein